MKHLVGLTEGWSLWTWACLRATGFAARTVLELASPELAAAADRLLDQEAEVMRRRHALIAACKAAADRAGPAERRALQLALRRLWHHRVPDAIADGDAEALRRRLDEAVTTLDALTRELAEHHRRAQHATSQALRRIAADDRFRQALLWQNPGAMTSAVDALLRQPAEADDSKTRAKQRLIAIYVQRYCVKNDTIGFFGPCGWARLGDDPLPIVQRPGPALLAGRTVYYEYWAIDAVAGRLARDPELRPFLVPRRSPHHRLDGVTLHSPGPRRSELPAEFAAVVARCDGERTARDIARELIAMPGLGIVNEAELLDLLDELARTRVVHWTLEIPTAGPHPEHHLAALVARIEDPALRRRAAAVLDELDRRRAEVAAASDAAALGSALAAFDAAFTAASDAASHRAHGQTYAARTPLYLECRRDLEVALGRPVLDRLAPPLALLFASARWFTHEIASRYRARLAEIHRRMRGGDGGPMELSLLWREVPRLFPGGAVPGSIVGDVQGELRRRWATVLSIDPAERAVQRSAAAVADAVRTAFAAPCPGWPAARHHSPDVLIAATDAGAIARGDYCVVVGELHTGFNTIAGPFLKLHPSPDELVAARDADIDVTCIAPVWSRAVTSADYYSPSPRDVDLESGDTRSARPRSQVVAISELVVDERDGDLEVRTRDGARRFDIIAFLEHHLIAESFAAFSLLAPAAWTPRVTIDDVVIARATWRVMPPELTWPALDDPAARFVAARRWARSLGMPRWVFARTPEEVKPVYVDFDSAIYVDMLARQLAHASAASLSEMLPCADHAWVVDAAGTRYTSELRIAAVDPVAWRPGGAR